MNTKQQIDHSQKMSVIVKWMFTVRIVLPCEDRDFYAGDNKTEKVATEADAKQDENVALDANADPVQQELGSTEIIPDSEVQNNFTESKILTQDEQHGDSNADSEAIPIGRSRRKRKSHVIEDNADEDGMNSPQVLRSTFIFNFIVMYLNPWSHDEIFESSHLPEAGQNATEISQ